ncbi:MAG: polyprenol monophosphomannose synthase [Candidatus Stahlbacteria bacterium]|nr:polyprenol monophosphomannose synthase [Candidatus Stahlbacteria bacterium]
MRMLIIIPTYNEIENIGNLISTIFSNVPEANILVIDDNSADGTGNLVDNLSENDSRIKIIHRNKKLGLGTAYKQGFLYAVENKYDYVMEMDADFSHNPKDIIRFLKAIKDSDVVVGSRYNEQGRVKNWPLARLLLSYFANLYARFLTGIPIRDLTSGFKAYRINVIKNILMKKISSDGYGFQIETLFWTSQLKFKTIEIPITFTERSSGKSKMNKSIIYEAFWVVLKLAFYKYYNT